MSENKKQEKSDPVKRCEEMYPQMTTEFKKILKEEYEIFCSYNPSVISFLLR